jgi:selenocysteine-specific elongation factor
MNDAGYYAALTARHAAFTAEEVAAATGATTLDATAALETLVDERRAFVLPDGRYLSDVAAGRLRDTARRVLSAYHRKNLFRRAMDRDELRAPLAKAAEVPDFDTLLVWLVAQGVVVAEDAGGVRLPEHTVELPEAWRRAADEMLAVFEAGGLNPPDPANFQAHYPRDLPVRTVLNVLADQGKLVQIADGMFVPAAAFEGVKAAVRRLAATPDGITVSGVREATGASRKVILPLLETLDTQGFTRRTGDARVLVERPAERA